MADQKVNIKVSTTGADKAKDQLGGVSGAVAKMGKAVGIASAAYFGARGLINGFSSVIELAGIQEQAEKRLEVALGRTSTALLDQASALQQITTFGDESIIGVQASIAAFVDSEEAIKKATVATLDIASAMGMDLQAAGDLVAKTLGSSTNAMSRYGIEVTGAVGSTERLESLTNNVAELFGGQASAQAETMAGALDQAKNASGDLAEAIGEKLSPLVEGLATNFAKTVAQLTNLIQGEEDLNFAVPLSESQIALRNFQKEIDSLSFFELMELQKELSENQFFIAQGEAAEIYNNKIVAINDNMSQMTQDIIRTGEEQEIAGVKMEKVNTAHIEYLIQAGKLKKEQLIQDLKGAALSGQTAKESMKSVVRAESMEAVAGAIASIFKSVPYPLNIIAAAGAGTLVSGLIDKGLQSFATGGIVQGDPSKGDSIPAMLTAGEVILNQAQQDNLVGNMGGVTINIEGNMIGNEEFVRDTLIPEVQKVSRENLA
tara:strand:+ start:396 stop:1862 length:1467 start_codon:yes stop_codon:yes gene_type:complete